MIHSTLHATPYPVLNSTQFCRKVSDSVLSPVRLKTQEAQAQPPIIELEHKFFLLRTCSGARQRVQTFHTSVRCSTVYGMKRGPPGQHYCEWVRSAQIISIGRPLPRYSRRASGARSPGQTSYRSPVKVLTYLLHNF